MSTLGKFFLYFALVGAIAAGVAGYLEINQYNATKVTLADTEKAKQAALKDAAAQKKTAEDTALAKAVVEKNLSTANDTIAGLNTQLATAQKAASDAQAAVASANDAAKTATDNLAKITATLKGNDPQKLIDDAAAAQKAAADALAEQKILQDQAGVLTAQVEQLKVDINNSNKHFIPPGVSGRVTFVNTTWNFVVLDVGLSNGVVPNGELIVYRGKTFLGKVKVTTAEANSCVADILPDIKGNIQVGDYVLN